MKEEADFSLLTGMIREILVHLNFYPALDVQGATSAIGDDYLLLLYGNTTKLMACIPRVYRHPWHVGMMVSDLPLGSSVLDVWNVLRAYEVAMPAKEIIPGWWTVDA